MTLMNSGHHPLRLAGVGESTLRKAITAGRVTKTQRIRPSIPPVDSPPSTKSQRSRCDAVGSEGMGMACTRADERTAAAFGLAESAAIRFDSVTDLMLGGVLCALPALCANELFSRVPPPGNRPLLHLSARLMHSPENPKKALNFFRPDQDV